MGDDHHHGFKLRGALERAKLEFEYYTVRDWPITDVGKFWDSVTDYDDINENTYSYFRRFVDAYHISTIKDDSYVLDVTPRTGNGTLYFHQKGKIAKAVGADVSDFQIEIYKKNLDENNINYTSVVLTDYTFPFPDNEFDAVLSFETVEHMGKPEKFISEIGRVVKEEGEVLLTCPNILWEPIHWLAAIFELHHSEGPHNFLTRRQLYRFFKNASLSVEVEKTTILIPAGPKWLTRIGEWLEDLLPDFILNAISLRRVFRLRKIS